MNIELFQKMRPDTYIGYVIYKDDWKSVWDGVTYPTEESALEEIKWSNITGYHVEKRDFYYKKKKSRFSKDDDDI